MTTATAARMSELVRLRVPFVHAVVVRAQFPTSVRGGDDAIILSDGSMEGFVGGQCAEGSVRAAALAALADGESLLLRVLPEGITDFPESPGAKVVVNPCLSGGAMEIFLQPLLPPPLIWVAGQSPIAVAVAELARLMGFHVGGMAETDGTAGVGDPAGATAVVVATHGRDEVSAIRAALDAGVGYIGLVASHKRADAVLADMELTDDERARVHSPAGLPIGARTAQEIALSITAELVAAMRTHGLTAPPPGAPVDAATAAAEPAQPVIDPVCGMTVIPGPGTPHLQADGEDIWFCGQGCRDRHAELLR